MPPIKENNNSMANSTPVDENGRIKKPTPSDKNLSAVLLAKFLKKKKKKQQDQLDEAGR
jgi:hypothetical protein